MKNSNRQSVLTRELDDNAGRVAIIGLYIVLALILSAVRLLAQDLPASTRGAVRPFVGAYIPTGDQRDFLKDAVLVGAQASWNATSNLGLTASFGWAPSKDKITPGDQSIDAFQYDLGLEGRSARTSFGGLTPFIGAGIGARTYNYRDLDVETKTNVAGYGALGLDASLGVIGVRLEARDYISQFEPLTGTGDTKTRNDVAVFAAVGVRF